jgi:hypothetical protein
MSYGAECLWTGSGIECVANFYKVIRNLKLNFTHHFAALLQHFIIIPVTFLSALGTDLS